MAVWDSNGSRTARMYRTPGPSRELLSIQYMRAIAAIAVLIFHAAQRGGGAFGTGAAGVDVFFVISGFIMWRISAKLPPAPGVFLARRAARIIPLYWLVTLVVTATAIVAPPLFPHLQPTFEHVVKSLLFFPHFDSSGDIAPLIVPGWTLDYEVFFYIIFAVSLIFAGPRRIVALTAMLGCLVLSGYWAHPSTPVLATYTDPLLLEFLAGVWLGKAWGDGTRLRPALGVAAIALGFVILSVVALTKIDVAPVRIFAWGIPSFLVVAGAISLEPIRKWRLLKFLGDASYSIYLVHGLALAFCARALAALHIESIPIFFVVSVLGGIGVGCVCYWLVEKPLLLLFQPPRRKRLAASATTDVQPTSYSESVSANPLDAA